jgi:hypothetical protein
MLALYLTWRCPDLIVGNCSLLISAEMSVQALSLLRVSSNVIHCASRSIQ